MEKITLGKIIIAHRALEEHAGAKVGVKLAYKLFRFRKEAVQHEEFYATKLGVIIEEYSLKDEAGKTKFDEKGNALIDTARLDECKQAIAEVENLEVDKPSLDFTLDELSELKMSMNDIARLEDFIREEE